MTDVEGRVSEEAFGRALASARFRASCDLKVIRRDSEAGEEEHPGKEFEELTVEEVVERFGASPGFEEWLFNAIEQKARREEHKTNGGL